MPSNNLSEPLLDPDHEDARLVPLSSIIIKQSDEKKEEKTETGIPVEYDSLALVASYLDVVAGYNLKIAMARKGEAFFKKYCGSDAKVGELIEAAKILGHGNSLVDLYNALPDLITEEAGKYKLQQKEERNLLGLNILTGGILATLSFKDLINPHPEDSTREYAQFLVMSGVGSALGAIASLVFLLQKTCGLENFRKYILESKFSSLPLSKKSSNIYHKMTEGRRNEDTTVEEMQQNLRMEMAALSCTYSSTDKRRACLFYTTKKIPEETKAEENDAPIATITPPASPKRHSING